MNEKQERYVVLGNGVAGLSAAAAIRAGKPNSHITMISAEDVITYSRPMLTKTPLNSFDLQNTLINDARWYQEHEIELSLSTTIDGLDLKNRMIFTSNDVFEYDKCIYALGASNAIPSVFLSDMSRSVSIRTYRDIQKLRRLYLGARSAIIVGGGVIGLESAFELMKLGIRVTIVEALPYLLPRFLDEETARELQLRLSPASVITGSMVAAVETTRSETTVRFSDGTSVSADFIVISTGVRANIALAKEAGLACERGVIVNERMETSAPGVYACGDCTQYKGSNAALWVQAKVQGEVAGGNAAGKMLRFGSVDNSLLFNSPKFALFAAGDTGKNPAMQYTVERRENNAQDLFAVNPAFTKSAATCWYTEGKLSGAVQIGSLTGVDELRRRIFDEKEIYEDV